MSGAVLTAGECMALLDPDGGLAHGSTLRLRVAGAESNCAIALARLGVPVRWISRLGDDPMGDVVLETLAREGVDTSLVLRDGAAPTAIFYKVRAGGRTSVHYYRAGSAASRLTIADVPDAALDGVSVVHLTGITMGISESAAGLVVDLASRARARGLCITFDLNWRPALWSGPAEAAAAYARVLPHVDWILCGLDEATTLFGGGTPADAAERLRAAGARNVVVRIGARGAVLVDAAAEVVVPPPVIVDVVDEVGAGDAFAAGFVYGLLLGQPPRAAIATANRLAGFALLGPGDWETLPYRSDLAG